MQVLCTNGLKTVVQDIAPDFERATGTTVAVTFASTSMLLAEIAAGATGDLAIMTAEAIDALIGQGKVAAGSRADLARSAIGIGVRKGARRPDIGSIDALRAALLAARAVAHSRTGISGLHMPAVLQHLGIAGRVNVLIPDPVTVGEAVVRGDAELAVQQISELLEVPGLDVVGPLPDAVQKITVFAAGIFADAADAKTARALVDALRSADVRPLYGKNGLEPVR